MSYSHYHSTWSYQHYEYLFWNYFSVSHFLALAWGPVISLVFCHPSNWWTPLPGDGPISVVNVSFPRIRQRPVLSSGSSAFDLSSGRSVSVIPYPMFVQFYKYYFRFVVDFSSWCSSQLKVSAFCSYCKLSACCHGVWFILLSLWWVEYMIVAFHQELGRSLVIGVHPGGMLVPFCCDRRVPFPWY